MDQIQVEKSEIERLTEEYGGQRGINHTRRLLRLVDAIAGEMEYDHEVVWQAAHLHDWGAYTHWAQDGVDHAVRSTQVSRDFMLERDYPVDLREAVLECIEFHHKGTPDQRVETLLLRDADILDLLGMVGMVRDFCRVPADFRKGYDNIKKRMQQLQGAVHFEKSRQIAEKRIEVMETCLNSFEEETFGCF
jgi:uncharacterized protein